MRLIARLERILVDYNSLTLFPVVQCRLAVCSSRISSIGVQAAEGFLGGVLGGYVPLVADARWADDRELCIATPEPDLKVKVH